MALTDQIWREDVIDEQDYVDAFTKNLAGWVERLRYQGAPPSLVQRIEMLRDRSAQLSDELEALRVCFPKQP